MAYGDLVGDLATAYLTPAQRLAQAKGVQSLMGGPIGRASAGLAAAAPLVANLNTPQPAPANLANAMNNPTQFARPPQPDGPASLESARPVGITPTATSPTFPTQAQVEGPKIQASLNDALNQSQPTPLLGTQNQASQQPVSQPLGFSPTDLTQVGPNTLATPSTVTDLNTAYRLTGTGEGSNAIAARVGANGVTEFSNAPADLRYAAGIPTLNTADKPKPANLADAYSAPGSGPGFAALGSSANMGDGIGTFSQAQAGDAQLAKERFGRAADLRDAYAAQDKLKEAQAAQTRDQNFVVVRDSSNPVVSRREQEFNNSRAQTTQSLADAVNFAQGGIDAQRQNTAYNQQQRQSQRLDDAFTAAVSPNATPEQKQAYQNLVDPTGANSLNRQLTQAKIAETNASTQKTVAEATGISPEAQQKAEAAKNKAQLDQLEIQRRQSVAAQTAKSLVDQKAGSIDVAREARDLANSISSDKSFSRIVGSLDSRLPTIRDESQDLVNKANRLQSLLTLDNLKLMSGVLTDKDIEFLGRIGSGLNVTENGIKGSEQGTKDRLKEIADRLTGKISEYEKSNPAQPAGQGQAARAASPAAPSVGSVQQGYVFLGGDPASQSSWRKQ